MAFTFGFYNSIGHDRRYNASQMAQLFDGIINDGVFANIGTAMVVTADSGLTVNVGIGRAWFNSTWSLNDAVYPIEATASDVLRDRIDAVVLEVDQREATRANRIFIKEGVASTTPKKPEMTNANGVYQHPLCYITRAPGSTEITQADIENCVGTSECPFVTGILSTVSTDDLIKQWITRFDELYKQLERAVEQTLAGEIVDNSVTLDKLASDVIDSMQAKLTTFTAPTGAKTLSFTVRGAGTASSNAWRRQMLTIQAWSQGADFASMQLMVDVTTGAPYGTNSCFTTADRNLSVESILYSTVGTDTTYTITFKAASMWALGYVTYKDGVGMSVVNAADITEGTSIPVDDNAAGSSMDLLWVNADPSGDFAATSKPISIPGAADYDYFMITFNDSVSSVIRHKGSSVFPFKITATKNESLIWVNIYYRSLTISNDGLTAGNCQHAQYNGSKFNSLNTTVSHIRPHRIYGMKGVPV